MRAYRYIDTAVQTDGVHSTIVLARGITLYRNNIAYEKKNIRENKIEKSTPNVNGDNVSSSITRRTTCNNNGYYYCCYYCHILPTTTVTCSPDERRLIQKKKKSRTIDVIIFFSVRGRNVRRVLV